MFNTATASGARVANVQQAINEIFDAVGMTGISDASRKIYATNNYIDDGDSHKLSIGKLDTALAALAVVVDGKETIPTSVTNFTVANNSGPNNVTGILLDMTAIRSATLEWHVYRKSTGIGAQTRVQTGISLAIHDDTTWTFGDGPMSGVDAGVVFTIDTATGQVKYTSDDNGGTYAAGTSVLTMTIVRTRGL